MKKAEGCIIILYLIIFYYYEIKKLKKNYKSGNIICYTRNM